MSSPPPPNNPSPLTIGRTFLKQYYHVLTTTPDMIYKFYRPSSVLSHGEGSNPSEPATLESLGDTDNDTTSTALKERFFSWSSGSPVRFELEHGAIDAQESVNGGVLLVVTGHLYLGEARKSFCHTFFLNVTPDSKKRQYYVHNDILRFLKEETPVVKESALSAVQEEEGMEEAAVTEDQDQHVQEQTVEEEQEQETPPELEESPVVVVEQERVVEVVDVVAPMIVEEEPVVEMVEVERVEGVEETKEEPIYEAGVEETKEDVMGPIAGTDIDPVNEPKAKPPPGSWASLVARSGSSAAPSPVLSKPSPKQPAKQTMKHPERKKEQQLPVKKPEKKDDGNQQKGIEQKPKSQKRDPDCTLVIKGVPDGTKETDVRLIFETFATQTNAKILGITVSQRGLAFVDYDAAAPVLMALAQNEKFSLNGKTVDIDQKTNDNKNRGNRGNANRTNGRSSRANNTSQNQRNTGSRGAGGGGGMNGGGGGRNGKSGK